MATRELPVGVLQHEHFPKDGRLRWLRCLDGIDLATAAGTPTIQALLTPLPEGSTLQDLPPLAELAKLPDVSSAHPVSAGMIPALRLGAVFLDGVHVGDLGIEASGPRAFGPSSLAAVVGASSDNPLPKPEKWTFPWATLPVSRYPLGRFKGLRLAQFHVGRQEVLVPCSEFFRVLCAPETRLANALLSDTWDRVRDGVLNEGWCERSDGRWQVGLRTGLTGRSALPAGAYEWTTRGRQVSSMLTATPMAVPGWKHLSVLPPYEYEAIVLEGDGLTLLDAFDTHRFLMLRLRSVSFPKGLSGVPADLGYRLDNHNRARREFEDLPFVTYVAVVPVVEADGVTGKVEVTPDDAPAAASWPAVVPYEPTTILGLPEPTGLALEPPLPEETRRRGLTREDPVGRAAAGVPHGRGHGVAGLNVVEGEPVGVPPGFGAVTSVLDELLEDGTIGSWRPTVPADWPSERIGGVTAWTFPAQVGDDTVGWCHLRSGRRRTCLVADMDVGGRHVHWLEIERQPPVADKVSEDGKAKAWKAFRFALLEAPDDQLEEVVTGLLKLLALSQGKWPRGADGALPGIGASGVRLLPLRHHFGGGGDATGGPPRSVSKTWVAEKLKGFAG